MRSVSVVVPVFNNEHTVERLIRDLRSVLQGMAHPFEIILVDDGSADASWSRIEALSRSDGRVKGLRLSRNFGQHAAITAGLESAVGDYVVLIDADLEDDARDLPALLAPVLQGRADVAIALNAAVDGKRTRISSRLFHGFFSKVADADVPGNINSYRVFTRQVANALLQYRERGIVYGPLMSKMGFRVEYVAIHYGTSDRSSSSYTFRRRWGMAMDSILSYSDIPYRAVMWMGMTLAVASSVFLVVFLVQYLLVDVSLVSGLGVVVAMLALFTGMMMLSISALFAYLIRVFREVLDRPRFHVMASSGVGLAGGDRPLHAREP